MGKLLVFSLVLLLVGVGTILALYHFKEKPQQAPPVIEFHNVSIKFFDNATKKEVALPFVVISDETATELTRGTYIGQDYGFTAFVSNQSFSIFNTQGKECFYTSRWQQPRIEKGTVIRGEIPVDKCGALKAMHNGNLLFGDDIVLNITSQGVVRHVGICLTWSPNILTVSAANLTKVNPPDRLRGKVVKCYDVDPLLNSGTALVLLEYRESRALQFQDYIKVTVIDGDIHLVSPSKLVRETDSREDIGLSDIVYTITAEV